MKTRRPIIAVALSTVSALLETEAVQQRAESAFLARYNFTEQDEMRFVAPTKVVDGQFGNPSA